MVLPTVWVIIRGRAHHGTSKAWMNCQQVFYSMCEGFGSGCHLEELDKHSCFAVVYLVVGACIWVTKAQGSVYKSGNLVAW